MDFLKKALKKEDAFGVKGVNLTISTDLGFLKPKFDVTIFKMLLRNYPNIKNTIKLT